MTYIFPNQRLSFAEKIKNDNEWGKGMINYLAHFNTVYNNNYNRKLSNYHLFNNILNQKDFEQDCNAMGIDVGQYKEVILPYNKTYNKIQVLLGEEMRRPFRFTVALINSEGIRKKENKKSEMLQAWVENEMQLYAVQLQQKIKAKQQAAQIQAHPEGSEAQQASAEQAQQEQEQLKLIEQQLTESQSQLIPPQELDKWHKTKYRDSREITGSKILNYLMQQQKIKEKKNDTFKHGLIAGESFLWIGATNKGPEVKVLNPLNTFYHKSPDTKYIQDGLFAGYKSYMPIVDILNEYGDYMDDADLDKLQSKIANSSYSGTPMNMGNATSREQMQTYQFDTNEDAFWQSQVQGSTTQGQYGENNMNQYMVVHCEWVSQRKIGFLSTINEFNEEQVEVVDENFIIPKNAHKEKKFKDGKECTYWYYQVGPQLYKYEEQWVPQVWEGTRLGQDIYVNIRPKQYQYFSIDRPSVHKLGYHGVVFNNMNADSVSLMDRMKPYQYLYFVVMHKLKKLIAKDQGKVYHFDMTMVPDELGLEKTMYYLQEMNIDFYNPLKNMDVAGAFQRGKVTNSTDMSNMQYIIQYINVLNYLDTMISDTAGVTRQREGQTSSSQAVTNAQSDLTQSALVTEIYFDVHNKMWEDSLNSLLSLARRYYKDNKKNYLQYVLDDLSMETIMISEDELEDCDLGVFVTDAAKENQVFDTLKQLSQAIIQNEAGSLSHVIGILQGDSLAELKREIKSYEDEKNSKQSQDYEAQRKLQMESAQFARETMMMKEQAITERELSLAELKIYQFKTELDQNSNGEPDYLEVERLRAELENNAAQIGIEKDKIKQKDRELEVKKEIEIIKAKNKPKAKSK